MEIAPVKRLEGLSEKIFLDRYALKDSDTANTKVGDLVLALTKEDAKFPAKEVGEVIRREGSQVSIKLRNGDIIETTIEKLTLTKEKTPDQLWQRLAKAMASVETTPEKQQEWTEKFNSILEDWKLVPGGRIAAGADASDELTLFNCYVIPSPQDSRGGIMKTLTEMTEIMARGGGVGINLSSLRPKRAIVKGVNGSSSGSVSWGGLFSYATGLIEQGGSRRGALMLMINDWHPDLVDFITVKQTAGQATNANLSVCVSNGFMKAVKEDLDWELVFPDTSDADYNTLWDGSLEKWKALGKEVKLVSTVKAREVWNIIIESAWKSAEPGVVFMERYNEMSNSWYFNPIICTNPCFHADTRISTEFGLIRIEDLFDKVGMGYFMAATDDRIMNEVQIVNGRSYAVPGTTMRRARVFPTGLKQTLRLELKNGMELKVTPDHRILTQAGWKEAKDLTRDDQVYIQSGSGQFAAVDELGEDWGLFLGWLTGEGWISQSGDFGMVFGEENEKVVACMVEIGSRLTGTKAKFSELEGGTKQIYWWKKHFCEQLLKLGVKPVKAPEQEVPTAIFTAARETVVAFIQGLFSANGTVVEDDERHQTVRLTAASRKLLQDVQLLLLNFGIHGHVYNNEMRHQARLTYQTIDKGYESKGFYELILSDKNVLEFKNQIGFLLVNRKQQALERIAHPSQKMEKFISQVESITEGEAIMVYDVNEPATHSLIANGFVAHNCGEQGLPAWGVCNLAAVNLSKFYDDTTHDVAWDELGKVVRYSTRFLDNVIDKTPYHFPENKENQQGERRIGLGTMGLAELMIKLEIRYGSPESLVFLDKIYGYMAKEAYIASAEIAAEKGSFKHFIQDKYLQSGFMKNIVKVYPEVGAAIEKNGMRNVTVITQAPTGSTGTMVGTSTGIEPYFAFEYYRQSRLGYDKQLVPIAQEWLDSHPAEELPDYYVTSMTLSAEDHIRVQAAIQTWVDSSISKTANCPADFTIEETARLYELAFELGCKGVTIYRDGSRDVQVLSTEKKADVKEEAVKEVAEENAKEVNLPSEKDGVIDKQYKSRPQILRGATYKVNTPFGMAYITINDLDGTPGEIFLNVGKAGSDVFAMSEALGRVCSLFLRYGDHGNKVNLLIRHLKGIGGSGAIGFGANRVESIADAVAKSLELHTGVSHMHYDSVDADRAPEAATLENDDGDKAKMVVSSKDICPSCGSIALINIEGCKTCSNCGYSKC